MTKTAEKHGIHDHLLPLAVDITALRQHPNNPRNGDIDAIARSLEAHGQFRPVVVRIDPTGRRTNEVLAGNHTLCARLQLGWTKIAATFYECDDMKASQILLVDNRLNDLSAHRYDDGMLAELLAEVRVETGALTGTGYTDYDFADLLAKISPPDLATIAEKYGTVDESKLWPAIRLQVPPDTLKLFQGLLAATPGKEDHAKFAAMLEEVAKYRDLE